VLLVLQFAVHAVRKVNIQAFFQYYKFENRCVIWI